jgi:hypothetical protein
MLSRSLTHHPDVPHIVQEFKGTEAEYWEHPYVLSNFLHDWMLDERIVKMHLWREDYIQGARSLLMMGYPFPDSVVDLPPHEVVRLARERESDDKQFRQVSLWSVSYEELTGGKQITVLPKWLVVQFCDAVGIEPEPIMVRHAMDRKIELRNEEEIRCLRV